MSRTIPMREARPLVAIISNVQVPYRLHFHRRIVRELPQIRLASLFTHDQPNQPWQREAAKEINPVDFGDGQPSFEPARLRWAAHDWQKGGRIIRWLTEQKAAAVVIGGYNDLTRIRVIAWCKRVNIPCFLMGDSNIKGDAPVGIRRLAKGRLVRWAVRSCVGVMPCGTLGAQYFARYGARSERTYFVPYEPDYRLFSAASEEDIASVLARFGLERARRRIVVCARLVPIKRVDLALEAFLAIARQRPEWDLVIVGDGPLRVELEKRVPAALIDRVKWTGFVGEVSDIAAIFQGSDVLLCPSDVEPWGVVINEAAAAGMAIVASDVVGAGAELVRHDVNGATFPAGNLEKLTEVLERATGPMCDAWRAASSSVLADWRDRGDPLAGLRTALSQVGIVSLTPTAATRA